MLARTHVLQAKAWFAWEMAVGFSTPSQELLLWSGGGGLGGRKWESAPHPQPSSVLRTRRPPAPLKQQLPSPASTTSTALTDRQLREQRRAWVWLADVQRRVAAAAAAGAPQHLGGDAGMPHATVQSRLECHYSVNAAFELAATPLLHPERIAALRTVPCIAVQGAEDLVCPPGTTLEVAWHNLLRFSNGMCACESIAICCSTCGCLALAVCRYCLGAA